MNTDALFYRLFETSPETLFLALGMSPEEAAAMAAKNQFQALEFKQTSHRTDGVFQPKEPVWPVYFVETQFYLLPTVYADILVKTFTYLKQHDPNQPYCAVVLFGRRSFEPEDLKNYQPLLDAGFLRRIFVRELSDIPAAPLGLSILRLIGLSPEAAPQVAKELIVRTKSEIEDEPLRKHLLELIETVIIHQLPKMSPAEIQAMLEVNDIRETRVFQDARAEGREEGREEERERVVEVLAAQGISVAKIAEMLNLDLAEVNRLLGE